MHCIFFFSSRRRHTRFDCDWSSDVCSSDLTALQTDYGAITSKAALAEAATGGGGDAKSAAETALEDSAFVLARALANHFKKTGDLDRLGKVDMSKTAIVKLRTQDLANATTAIRDLG